MSLTVKQLSGLPVETESGQSLGKICNFVFDPGTHTILQYEVSHHPFLRDILGREFLIANTQVVSITTEKMVVEDSTVRGKEKVAEPTPSVST